MFETQVETHRNTHLETRNVGGVTPLCRLLLGTIIDHASLGQPFHDLPSGKQHTSGKSPFLIVFNE